MLLQWPHLAYQMNNKPFYFELWLHFFKINDISAQINSSHWLSKNYWDVQLLNVLVTWQHPVLIWSSLSSTFLTITNSNFINASPDSFHQHIFQITSGTHLFSYCSKLHKHNLFDYGCVFSGLWLVDLRVKLNLINICFNLSELCFY